MQSENRVILVGNLGGDAELRTNLSTPQALFTVATSESWMKDNERHEKTEWHRVVVWGKTAETLAPFLTKGRAVYVTGKISYRDYEKDGVKRYLTEIRADRIILLGHKQHEEAQQASAPAKPAPARAASKRVLVPTDDDIPF